MSKYKIGQLFNLEKGALQSSKMWKGNIISLLPQRNGKPMNPIHMIVKHWFLQWELLVHLEELIM